MNKELSEHLRKSKRPSNRESKKAKATPWDGRVSKAGSLLKWLWVRYSLGPLSPPCSLIDQSPSRWSWTYMAILWSANGLRTFVGSVQSSSIIFKYLQTDVLELTHSLKWPWTPNSPGSAHWVHVSPACATISDFTMCSERNPGPHASTLPPVLFLLPKSWLPFMWLNDD